MEPRDVVLRFLESVGRPSEARFYVELFRGRPREQFAAINVDANVLRDASEAVVLDLRFLAALDLLPTVLLGLFAPADVEAHARRLRRRLERAGVATTVVDAADSQLADRVRQAQHADALPLVTFGAAVGATVPERMDVLGRLLSSLAVRKLIFLHRPGGLRQRGALVPLVSLTTDYAALAASRELSRKERVILEQSRRLVLEGVPHAMHVAVTSPLNLFRELFTVKGAGTLLRRGAVIVRHDGWQGVDRDRLRQLLASSFGRPPADDFFDRPVWRVYREEAWRGAVVLLDTPLGAYLTKFAVGREAQGEGIARDLWAAVSEDVPTVFWRARATNPIVEWYDKLADGLARAGEWTVYWKGLLARHVPDVIAHCLAQPADFPAAPDDALPSESAAAGGDAQAFRA
jgi:acetylglutamate kinase